MPSNDSPAFDVLSADENDLWEWAVKRAGVENAATYIREATLKAVRASQTERETLTEAEIEREWNKGAPYNANRWEHVGVLHRKGIIAFARRILALREPQAPEAEREPNELADAQRLLAIVMEQRAELTAEVSALKQSRDTDLARARREGIREGLTRYADSLGPAINARDVAERMSVLAFRDREYPAPKPAECRLSDGSVVTYRETTAGSYGSSFWRTRDDGGATMNGDWRGLLTRPTDTGADFDALKTFAATRTEGTDGR